ncbi:hypothetical protein BDN72DRAFT_857105 [Pluteus cervinus]|uniref:Uncharacterized protein n=1 Tax=Pluteus cervinus TaxID=181527 RepID=A0ACD3AYW5_9AGAR|nr:hypothetical protein BDN72DRAFT_857105 [Pluteus cervinus]
MKKRTYSIHLLKQTIRHGGDATNLGQRVQLIWKDLSDLNSSEDNLCVERQYMRVAQTTSAKKTRRIAAMDDLEDEESRRVTWNRGNCIKLESGRVKCNLTVCFVWSMRGGKNDGEDQNAENGNAGELNRPDCRFLHPSLNYNSTRYCISATAETTTLPAKLENWDEFKPHADFGDHFTSKFPQVLTRSTRTQGKWRGVIGILAQVGKGLGRYCGNYRSIEFSNKYSYPLRAEYFLKPLQFTTSSAPQTAIEGLACNLYQLNTQTLGRLKSKGLRQVDRAITPNLIGGRGCGTLSDYSSFCMIRGFNDQLNVVSLPLLGNEYVHVLNHSVYT